MPVGEISSTGGSWKKGKALGNAWQRGWAMLTDKGFSVQSGGWSLRKGRNGTQAGFELSNAVGGLSTNTMLAIAGVAYLLFKK